MTAAPHQHRVENVRAESRFALAGALCSLYGGTLVWARENRDHGLLSALLVLGASAAAGWYLLGGPSRRTALGRVARALRHQRLTFVPLLPLALLTVASGSAILDQLPDVQRRWVTDDELALAGWSIATTSLLAVALYALGRLRTHQARERCAGATQQPGYESFPRRMWSWLVLPALPLVLWLIPASWPHVQPRQVLGFMAVPLLVVAASWVLRTWWGATEPPGLPGRAAFACEDLVAISRVGDLAAHGIAVIGAWSLIRSFTPLVGQRDWGGAAAVFVTLGFLFSAGVWAVPLLRHLAPVCRFQAGLVRPGRRRWLRAAALAASIGCFLLVAWLGPVLAPRIGVPATATLTLGLLTGIVASLALELNAHETPEALRWLGFRSAPVVSTLVGAVLISAFVTPHAEIHRIFDADLPAQATPDPRPTLDEEFAAWLGRPGCVVPARPDGLPVRPMLLVAAEGGGIRATWWTVDALRILSEGTPGECGRDAGFLAGGASGGAVGLTVATFSAKPRDAVRRMARPEALAQASAALFSSDLLYGLTGAPLPPHADGPSRQGWRDRALLIENSWVGAEGDPDAWGAVPFVGPRRGPAGALVLNSTSSARGCRVWLSQLSFGAITGRPGDCDSAQGPAQRTIDFFAAYRPFLPRGTAPSPGSGEPSGCVGELRAATVALLTARFPYVTPSGVVGPCGPVGGQWERMNLVDGGYVENSGLATLTDLAPEWVKLLREHNTCVAARRPACAGRPLVAPVIVYLNNGVDPTVSSAWYEDSELFIPLLTGMKGKSGLSNDAALLSRAAKLVDPSLVCPTGLGTTCAGSIATAVPRRVIDVKETEVNLLRAPLGWVLSEASRRSLIEAMQAQRSRSGTGATTGSLGDLVAMLGGDAFQPAE